MPNPFQLNAPGLAHDPHWYRKAVFYEVLVRGFADANGDGSGDLSGLIEKRFPGQEKSGRQVTVSADLIYDVLRTHEPDHILLQATRADAAAGLLDVRRLADMLSRIKGRIMHKDLERISPLAVPIMLEVGRERVDGEASDSLLSEAGELIGEAMGRA